MYSSSWQKYSVRTLMLFGICHFLFSAHEAQAEEKRSAIVFGLGEEGIQIHPLVKNTANIFFDLKNNNFAESTNWVGSKTGFLITQSSVNSFKDLLSAQPDVISALKKFDDNGDGIIDEHDKVFSTLRLWVDTNQNGKAEKSEIYTLPDLNIKSIDLPVAGTQHPILQFTLTDGTHGRVSDFVFESDPLLTQYTGTFNLNRDVLVLPLLHGYGIILPSYIATSIDSDLFEAEKDLVQLPLASMGDFDKKFFHFLSRWAGVADIAPDSRGPLVDARQLSFIEKIQGVSWVSNNWHTNPYRQEQADKLEEAYAGFFIAEKARFIVQAPFGSKFLFARYNYENDTYRAIGVNDFSLAATEIATQTPIEAIQAAHYWAGIVPILNSIADELHVQPAVYQNILREGIVRTQIPNAQAALSNNGIIFGKDMKLKDNGEDTKVDYSVHDAGAHLIIGGAGYNIFHGGDGDDTLIAGFGHNVMHGGGGANVFYGGTGRNEIFVEGIGDRVYCDTANNLIHLVSTNLDGTVINGDGQNTTLDASDRDISRSDITQVPVLQIKGGTKTILNDKQLADFHKIMVIGNDKSSAELLLAQAKIFDVSDKTILGRLTLVSGDTNTTFVVKNGDIQLVGNGGSDVYRIIPGDSKVEVEDHSEDSTGSAQSEIRYAGSISPLDLWLQRTGYDLVITNLGTRQTVRVVNWFSPKGSSIKDIITDTGFVLNADKVPALVKAINDIAYKSLNDEGSAAWLNKDYLKAMSILVKTAVSRLTASSNLVFHHTNGPPDDITELPLGGPLTPLTSFWVR